MKALKYFSGFLAIFISFIIQSVLTAHAAGTACFIKDKWAWEFDVKEMIQAVAEIEGEEP